MRSYQAQSQENPFISPAVRGMVNPWNWVEVRYSCIAKCMIIATRVPETVAFWDHRLLDGDFSPSLGRCTSSTLAAESLSITFCVNGLSARGLLVALWC